MTPEERKIAEALMRQGRARDYATIHEEVMKTDRIPFSDILDTVNALVEQEILKAAHSPSRNMSQGPRPDDEFIVVWYEKGPRGPKD